MNRLAILLLAALGGALVGRTGLVYLGADPVAFGIVALIGLGLLAGVVELWGRVGRAQRVRAEVAALPTPATSEAIDGASAPVRAWLRAACAGRSGSVSKAGFTPYLLGLLVMVGLLGTFLGLVDTLAGARKVIGHAVDVDALRAGLAAPFAGLTKAFGTSVAGIAASATLGLAAVFARRAEAVVRAALEAYANGPLLPLTPAGRQLRTFELLETLAARSAAGAAEAAGQALTTHLAAVHAALEASAEREATRTDTLLARVDQLLDGEAARATARQEASDALLDAVAAREAERTEALVATLDAAHAERNQAALRAMDDMRARQAEDAGAMAALLGDARDAVVRLGSAEGERIEAAAKHFESSVACILGGLDDHARRDRDDLTRLTKLTTEHLEQGALQTDSMVASVRDLAAQLGERSTAQLHSVTDAVAESVRTQAEQLAVFETQLAEARARSGEALAERLTAHADGLAGKLDATTTVVGEASDLLRAGGAELSAVAEMFTEAVDSYRESNERWLAALGHLETTLDARGDGTAAGVVGEYLDQTREVFGDAMRFQRELFTELRAMRGSGPS